jgi:hypothetical protein
VYNFLFSGFSGRKDSVRLGAHDYEAAPLGG